MKIKGGGDTERGGGEERTIYRGTGQDLKGEEPGPPREAGTLSSPPFSTSLDPLHATTTARRCKKLGPSVPGFALQGAAEGGFESLEQARTHSTQTHSGRWGHTRTLSTWVGVVLQGVLGAGTSLLPLAHCDGQVSCSGHQDPASVFPFFTFLLDK